MINDKTPASFPNTHFDIVALAASAGGINALSHVISDLPEDFPAAVLILQHLEPHRESKLAVILRRKTAMRVEQAEDGMKIMPGVIYTAPPNYHMLVEGDGRIHLNQLERVNFSRPAIDPLIESMAEIYHSRIIVVILSGMGGDGSKGLAAVKARGGEVIVQSPEGSEFQGMPSAAVRTGKADWVLPLETISTAVLSLVHTGVYQ